MHGLSWPPTYVLKCYHCIRLSMHSLHQIIKAFWIIVITGFTVCVLYYGQALLENPAVRHEVQVTHTSTSDSMRDFCDGEFIKQHPVVKKHPTALQIVLYYDDIEIANPLGSQYAVIQI